MKSQKHEKREVKSYKAKPSIYDKAMKKCRKGVPLATRIEAFVTEIAETQ